MLAFLLAISLAISTEQICSIHKDINEPVGQYELEAKQLAKSLSSDTDHSNMVNLAEHYRDTGEYKKGLKLLEPLLEENPNDLELQKLRTQMALQRINKSGLFGKLGAAKKMRKACEADLERAPSNSTAMLCLARFFGIAPGIAGGSKDRRDEILDTLKEVDPVNYHLARVTSGAVSEPTERVKVMKSAIGLDDSSEVRLQLATAYAANEDWDATLEVLKSLVDKERDTMIGRFALYQIGNIVARSGANLELGAHALRNFLEGPTWVSGNNLRSQAYVQLGEIYSHADCKAEQKKALEIALERDPKNKRAKKALRELR
jgi:tetratricopeptide (TPR) repeat protein